MKRFKDLKISMKMLLGIGGTFLITILVLIGVIIFNFNSLGVKSDELLKKSLLEEEYDKARLLAINHAKNISLLYNENKDRLSKEELKKLIANKNSKVRFDGGNYFYIYDYKGNTISLPPNRKLEGTNRWSLEIEGQHLLKDMARTAKDGGGIYKYTYTNPDTKKEEVKFGYIHPIEGTNWFIGVGGYESVINSILQKAVRAIKKARTRTIHLILIIVAIATIICSWFIFKIAKYIKRNITQLLSECDKVAEGDLTVNLDIKSKDEFGQLAKKFNKMITDQSGVLREIINSIEEISSFSQQLSASSQEGNAVINTSSEGIDQMAVAIEQIANSSQEVTDLVQKAHTKTEIGSKKIEKTIVKMKDINKVVNNTRDIITNLDNTSQEIGEIIEMITNIAEETNLLALNASIEAARAGEHGHGFAVVAEEIKSLADDTAKATERAIKLIKGTQNKSKEGLQAIKETVMETHNGEELIQETGLAFEDISDVVEDTSAFTQEVSASTEELAANSDQITNATDDMNNMSEEITKSAQELANLAQNLKILTDNYKL